MTSVSYASVDDVQARLVRTLTNDERDVVNALLDDSAVIIDAYAANASASAKKVVSCRMVIRALGDGTDGVPVGASQGSMSALGYSQSWTITAGSTGELYLARLDKKLLGTGDRVGSYSPVQELVPEAEP